MGIEGRVFVMLLQFSGIASVQTSGFLFANDVIVQ